MQIQRLQNLYILLAIIVMVVFLFVPYGEVVSVADQSVAPVSLSVLTEWGLLLPVGATIVALISALFYYKRLPGQRQMVTTALILTFATIGVVCFTLFKEAGAEELKAQFSVWDIILPIAVVFELLAVKYINRDRELLASANRLR
ncbi:MAG: DUF4293 family protein [Duncaniella sp.]|nr:DUF4293 family protein [Duncaniella sp.]